jgi:hypothetical protein
MVQGMENNQQSLKNDSQMPGYFDGENNEDAISAVEESSLYDAAVSIPDADAMSVSSLQTTSTDRAADEQTAAVLAGQADDETSGELPLSTTTNREDTRHEIDWNHLLGLSGQGLNAANTATSFGLAAARTTTTFSLNLVKRLTQGIVALPAMALDGTLGNAPSMSNYVESRDGSSIQPSIASVAHSAVGGLFDVISALAVGGIDIGTVVTGAGIGAAVSGVEGVRRALGSEVLRSLGAFSRLVRREWNSASDTLPPGGMPAYSIIGITQALTAWVCIQMVTREYYEKRMLKNLQVVDLKAVEVQIRTANETEADADKAASVVSTPGEQTFATAAPSPAAPSPVGGDAASIMTSASKKKRKQVRILDDHELPNDEGDIIDAEIGDAASTFQTDAATPNDQASLAGSEPKLTIDTHNIPPSFPIAQTDAEAISGLKRYSRLVLGVYGGVALAWLGSLPPDLMQAAGATVDESSSSQQGVLSGRRRGMSAAQVDQRDFLRAAATLDLDHSELIEDEKEDADAGMQQTGQSTPVNADRTSETVTPQNEVLFSANDEANSKAQAAQPVTDTKPAAGRSYSYYDILMGTADEHLFHRVANLTDGAALEGSYEETASQADTAAERLRRMQNRVARPSKPRYYVVTDHTQRKIVLVLRGSLTLGDIAIDLTCESANFDVHAWDRDAQDDQTSMATTDDTSEGPASAQDFSSEAMHERRENTATAAQERRSHAQAREYERSEYIVHEGMYETAKEIGEVGRPVHRAVRRALLAHPGYDLDITGHSLGAGVASLLALMWASPNTGMTTQRSGLPKGRKTHAYAFAVPCVMGAKLGKRAESLVTSYCYSYDLVCRLSLGAILDIRNACGWLAYENQQTTPRPTTNGEDELTISNPSSSQQHYGLSHPIRLINVMQRSFLHQSNRLNAEQKASLEADFLALRKTLEANMNHVELYPPGVLLYSLQPADLAQELEPEEGRQQVSDRMQRLVRQGLIGSTDAERTAQKAVLYRLRDDGRREEVFGQIIHGKGMLSRHMPHIYHYGIDAL